MMPIIVIISTNKMSGMSCIQIIHLSHNDISKKKLTKNRLSKGLKILLDTFLEYIYWVYLLQNVLQMKYLD